MASTNEQIKRIETDILKVQTKNQKRIRRSLAAYREAQTVAGTRTARKDQ